MHNVRQLPAHAETVIIGGGVLGAVIAHSLAEEGIRSIIIERGDFLGEASGANVGLINVSDKPPPSLQFELARRSVVDLYPELDERLGSDAGYESTGLLSVAVNEQSLANLREIAAAQQAAGFENTEITVEEARAMEPMIPVNTIGALYSPHGGFVYPFAFVAAFLKRARELGVTYFAGTEAIDINVRGGRVVSVETTRGTIQTERVINAAGAWAEQIGDMVGVPIPMDPVRGQLLVTEPLTGLPHFAVAGVSPSIRRTWAANGIIGSVQEYAGYDKLTTLGTMRAYAQGITSSYPALKDVQVMRAWSGLRPKAQDGELVLGEALSVEGFIIATGAFDSGMIFAPAIGEIIRDIVLGREPAIDISAARPERFSETMSEAHV